MKSKNKLSKYMIITGTLWCICAVVVGLSYMLLYQPQKVQLTHIETQYTDSQIQLEQALVAAQDETKEKMHQRLAQTDKLIESFATKQDAVTSLVFQIGQIANDLKLAEFSSKNQTQPEYSTIADNKLLTEIWLNVKFESTYNQFSQFVNRLERNCPAVFVEEVSLKRGNDGAQHKATFKLSFLAETKPEGNKIAAVTHSTH